MVAYCGRAKSCLIDSRNKRYAWEEAFTGSGPLTAIGLGVGINQAGFCPYILLEKVFFLSFLGSPKDPEESQTWTTYSEEKS